MVCHRKDVMSSHAAHLSAWTGCERENYIFFLFSLGFNYLNFLSPVNGKYIYFQKCVCRNS